MTPKPDTIKAAVWCIYRHGDDGHQQLWHVCGSLEEAWDVSREIGGNEFLGYWWTIRQHEVGKVDHVSRIREPLQRRRSSVRSVPSEEQP